MLVSSFRIIKFSLQDIFRNIWLSLVTVTILILALFSVNVLLVVRVVSNTAVEAVREKIDISLYLREDASEDQIKALEVQLSNIKNVKEVEYISRAEALSIFQERNKENPEILSALQELGNNPLTASLIIKPDNAESIEELENSLNRLDNDIIESRNFTDYELMLGKINNITNKINAVGMLISLMFGFISILVVYNSIRVAIYTHRKEIAIMRLVGASNKFIYMPFLLSGLIYSVVAVSVILLAFYPFLSLLQPYLEAFFIGYDINLITYFNDSFVKIFGLQLAGVAMINIIASLIAVRKYARI